MTDVSKGRPVHRPAAFWVILGLIIFGLIIFLPAIRQLPFDEWLPDIHFQNAAAKKKKLDEKVWVNKHSGFYYCPNSQGYGTQAPGEYMTRSEANQKGFRPAPNVGCN
jgi:hypothetical protein